MSTKVHTPTVAASSSQAAPPHQPAGPSASSTASPSTATAPAPVRGSTAAAPLPPTSSGATKPADGVTRRLPALAAPPARDPASSGGDKDGIAGKANAKGSCDGRKLDVAADSLAATLPTSLSTTPSAVTSAPAPITVPAHKVPAANGAADRDSDTDSVAGRPTLDDLDVVPAAVSPARTAPAVATAFSPEPNSAKPAASLRGSPAPACEDPKATTSAKAALPETQPLPATSPSPPQQKQQPSETPDGAVAVANAGAEVSGPEAVSVPPAPAFELDGGAGGEDFGDLAGEDAGGTFYDDDDGTAPAVPAKATTASTLPAVTARVTASNVVDDDEDNAPASRPELDAAVDLPAPTTTPLREATVHKEAPPAASQAAPPPEKKSARESNESAPANECPAVEPDAPSATIDSVEEPPAPAPVPLVAASPGATPGDRDALAEPIEPTRTDEISPQSTGPEGPKLPPTSTLPSVSAAAVSPLQPGPSSNGTSTTAPAAIPPREHRRHNADDADESARRSPAPRAASGTNTARASGSHPSDNVRGSCHEVIALQEDLPATPSTRRPPPTLNSKPDTEVDDFYGEPASAPTLPAAHASAAPSRDMTGKAREGEPSSADEFNATPRPPNRSTPDVRTTSERAFDVALGPAPVAEGPTDDAAGAMPSGYISFGDSAPPRRHNEHRRSHRNKVCWALQGDLVIEVGDSAGRLNPANCSLSFTHSLSPPDRIALPPPHPPCRRRLLPRVRSTTTTTGITTVTALAAPTALTAATSSEGAFPLPVLPRISSRIQTPMLGKHSDENRLHSPCSLHTRACMPIYRCPNTTGRALHGVLGSR